MKKDYMDIEYTEIDISFDDEKQDTRTFKREINLSYWIANIFLRIIMFCVTFTAVGVLWMCLELLLYEQTFESISDAIVGAIFSMILSTVLFNKYMIEEIDNEI